MTASTSTRISIEDRLDIIDLRSKYAFLVDQADLEGVLDLWVDDEPIFDELPLGLKRSVGKEQLRAYYKDDVFAMTDGMAHLTANHLIDEVTDTTARGRCAVMFDGDVKDGAGAIHATGWYDDTYERVNGEWKFRSRVVRPFTKPQMDNYHG